MKETQDVARYRSTDKVKAIKIDRKNDPRNKTNVMFACVGKLWILTLLKKVFHFNKDSKGSNTITNTHRAHRAHRATL